MIVLHGTWKIPENSIGNGVFFLWGESSSLSVKKKRGRPSKTPVNSPLLHPYQVPESELFKVVDVLNIKKNNFSEKKIFLDQAIILLPSSSKYPIASLELLRESFESRLDESIEFSSWRLQGLSLSLEYAFLLFNSIPIGQIQNEGILLGKDLCFWSLSFKFALELLSKQRFFPDITVSKDDKGKIESRWRFLLENPEEFNRLTTLADSMPSVCIALQGTTNSKSRETYLSDFLNSVIDYCIRNWISPNHSKQLPKKNSIANLWLNSLLKEQALEVQMSQQKYLLEGIESWKKQILDTEKTNFKTCFRLEDPDDEVNDKPKLWVLRYFIQALDDPSLLIPADKIWKESKDTLSFLNREFNNPQEKLLTDLGKASHLFLPIENSLNSARPTSIQLTMQEAYDFLKETVPLFQESGFGVLIPPWWHKNTTSVSIGLKLNLTPKHVPKGSLGHFGLDSIIKYNWQASIGNETISPEEFQKLVNLKEPFIKIRGQWVEIKKEDLEIALKFFKSKKSGELKLSEALRLSIGQTSIDEGLPINSITSSGWLSELFEQLSGIKGIQEKSQPHNFNGKLRPYQIKGFSWLSFLKKFGLGACLADDMGLGKTIQILALLLNEKKNKTHKPSLLVCPTSIIGNWQREAGKFAPSLCVLIHHGPNRITTEELISQVEHFDLIITTYGLAYRDENLLTQIEWNGLFLDEAQKIKNFYTKQAQAIRKLKGNFRVALTGTPVENRLSELWSIMEFLNPGYLGSDKHFHNSFASAIERYNDKDRRSRLKTIIQPFILRRLKTDSTIIKDLPDKIEMKAYCSLTKEQATLYQAVVNDMLNKIDDSQGIKRKGMVLSTITKLKQVCNHPAQFLKDNSAIPNRSGKIERLIELLEEILAEDQCALIFTQFAEMGEILKSYLQNYFTQEVLFLHGRLNQKTRDQMIQRFSEPNGPKVFILSLKAGGLGLNLTRASHVLHFDRWWNPAIEDQATDRVFRIGQTKNVIVHKFICSGTLEEKIDEMIERKKSLISEIIGTGESWLAEMSTQQLREIFSLRKEVLIDE
jgi:SNF2 family DNA or RNA helicase